MTPPEPILLERHRGRIHLCLCATAMGRDLCVTLSGGDRPHLGAVALATPGAPIDSLTLPRHREEVLARELALELASACGATVCVACGIHLEAILPGEIQEVLELSRSLAAELGRRLKHERERGVGGNGSPSGASQPVETP